LLGIDKGKRIPDLWVFRVSESLVSTEIQSAIVPKRILIADDSEVVRSVVRSLLKHEIGLEVCGEAVDGLEAIDKAKDLKPDLVLVDFRMPYLNGVEVASIIKKALPQVRIILFTLFGNQIPKTMATAAYIDLVVSKPDGMSKLLESIQDLLATT
jgi:DNA-binding NarL/FixJ family response regulator